MYADDSDLAWRDGSPRLSHCQARESEVGPPGSAATSSRLNPTLMSEHQNEMAFLRHLLVYDNTEERHTLEERIAQVQRDERSVVRAAWLMALFTVLAATGLAYGAIVEENFPYNESQFVVRVSCNLGLASLMCLVAYAGLLTVHRKKLNRLREECRQLITRLLKSHLGDAHPQTSRDGHPESGDRPVDPSAAEVRGSPGPLDSLRKLTANGEDRITQ